MTVNWIDGVVLAVIVYYAWSGWQSGLLYLLANLIGFLSSLWIAIRYHEPVGQLIGAKFGIAATWRQVFGYVVVAFVSETVVSLIVNRAVSFFPKRFLSSRANHILGAIAGALNGLVLVTFFLLLVTALPIRGTIKSDIRTSPIAVWLIDVAKKFSGDSLDELLNGVRKEAVKFTTIAPASQEWVALDVAPDQEALVVSEQAEGEMLVLVNKERAKVGAPALVIDPKIVPVARAHSRDMFVRRYFAHVNPDGKDAGDRMTAGNVEYRMAGENLAYAPDVATAHEGLMNSEGHKRNILDPDFHRIGIGVIDAGSDGMMFTQNFAD